MGGTVEEPVEWTVLVTPYKEDQLRWTATAPGYIGLGGFAVTMDRARADAEAACRAAVEERRRGLSTQTVFTVTI